MLWRGDLVVHIFRADTVSRVRSASMSGEQDT